MRRCVGRACFGFAVLAAPSAAQAARIALLIGRASAAL